MGLSISGLGDWFKKRLDDTQGVYHQVNVFDGGRTFDTNRRAAVPYIPPANVRSRNVFQKGFDQVNFMDNGRSWQTATPDMNQPIKSGLAQFGDATLPIGKAIVRPPAQMLNTIAAQIPQAYYTGAGVVAQATGNQEALNNAIKMQNIANEQFDQNKGGLFNVGTFYGADDAKRGDLATGVKKIGGGTLQTAATVVPFAKGGQVIVGSQPLTKGLLLRLAKEGAGYGASYSAGNQLQEKGSIDPKQLLRDTALGTVGNVALPVAGRGIKNGVQMGVQKGVQVADNATPLNQIGSVGRNVLDNTGDDFAKLEAKNRKLIMKADKALRENKQIMLEVDGAAPSGVKIQQPKSAKSPIGNVSGSEISKEVEATNLMEFIASPFSSAKDVAKAKARLQELAGTTPSKGIKVSKGAGQPPAATAPLEVVQPGANQKLSRFANRTIQQSDEVSDPLKVLVKDQQVTYNPVTNKDRLVAADAFLQKKSNNSAYTHVVKTFENTDKVTDQDVVTAIQAAKRMDASGKENDLLKATEIYDTLSRHLTKKGQEIQAASLLNNRTPQGLLYQAQKNLRKAGVELTPDVQKNLKGLVDAVKKQKPGTYEDGLARFKVMEYVEKLAPAGAADKGVQMWKAGLLSAPTTTGGNLAANTAESVYRKLYQDPIANGADMIMSLFTGKRSRSYTARGLFEGGKEGIAKGVKYFKTGYDPRNPLEKFDIKSIHFSDKPLGKAAETYTQSIFKLMGAQDQPYYYAALRNSLADQAVTAAKNAGLKGDARAVFIKKFITEPAKDAMQLADDEARYAVFQNKTALGGLASKVNKGPVGQFMIPFSQVPSSIATRMIERTPIGLAKEIVSQVRRGAFDQRAMSKALADSSAGLIFIGAGAALEKAGMLTTSYPTDQKERDLWELEGKQPNSVRIGDTWVSLNYFQPMGTLFAAGANYEKAKRDGKNQAEAWSSAAAGASKAFTEQSFLKGVSGGLQALADPQRAAEKFAEQTAGSVVPNFIRSAARSADPVNRVQDGLGEAVVAGIPGLRQTLPVRTDIFGDPVPRKTSGWNSYLNPLRPSDVRPSTDLNSELRRLQDADEGVTATKIIKDALGEGTELNRDQQLELRNLVGQQLKGAWSEAIKDGRYESLTDGDKRRVLEKIKDDIGAVIRAQYGQAKGIKVMDSSKLSTNQQLLLANGGLTPDYLAGAGDQTARDNFSASGQKYQVIGDNVYYKAPNGDVIVKPKALLEYERTDANLNLQLDRAKGANNLQAWAQLAEQKIQNLERKKQFYDPMFEGDEIAKITLQQENLMEQAEKYAEYGGFTKGGGRNGRGVNLPDIGVTVSSDLMAPVVTKGSYRAPAVALRNKGTPSVRVRKSSVKIKAPKRLA